VLVGTAGPDVLAGRGGNDIVYGGPGNDSLNGGGGHDRLYGGTGDDHLFANDGVRDIVDCGPGRDEADADGMDIVSGCELVRRHGTMLARAPRGVPRAPELLSRLLKNVACVTKFETPSPRSWPLETPNASKRGRCDSIRKFPST
jgi:hypothetical protein